MGQIRYFTLALIAVFGSLALLGASSALANQDTALCEAQHEGVEQACPPGTLASALHLEAGTTELVTNTAKFLCLSSLAQGVVEGDGVAKAPSPLGVQLTALTWNNCGSNSTHQNCAFESRTLPLIDVLRTGLSLGAVTLLNVEILMTCDGIVHCRLGGTIQGLTIEGALHNGATHSGRLLVNGVNLPRLGGTFCPQTVIWYATYESLDHLFLAGAAADSEPPPPHEDTALCNVQHEEEAQVCPAGELATALHLEAETTLLVTNLAAVLCLSSLAQGAVEGDGVAEAPNALGVQLTSLIWKGCGTTATHDNCEVINIALPLIDILKSDLNLGVATALGANTLVECGLFIHCRFGATIEGLKVEGALHNGATHSGRLRANGVNVPPLGGLLCPTTAQWYATYESLDHLFVTS